MIDKILTVCRMAQGKRYTLGINLKGDYLQKYGFEVGDMVKVEVKQNQIVITKNKATQTLTEMGSKNPAIMTLIDGLNLEIA